MKPLYRYAFYVLLAIAGIQGVALYLGRRALWHANLATANAKAARDTTRTHFVGRLAIAERLIVQKQVELDAALRREGQRAQALVRLTLERDSLVAQVAAVVAIDTSAGVPGVELHAVLDARDSLGVYLSQQTSVRGVLPIIATPTAATRFEVYTEPVALDVAVSCQEHDAIAQVSGPRWAKIDLKRVEAQPEICNPKPPSWHPFSLRAPSLPWAAGLVGLGFVLRSMLGR
jgi:hypothetical protein